MPEQPSPQKGSETLLRIVFIALCVGIMIVGAQTALALITPLNEAADYTSRRDGYILTATALTLVTPTETAVPVEAATIEVTEVGAGIKDFPERLRQFATNTPAAPVETPTPTATDTPALTNTPRPLPTLMPYGNAPEGASAPTAIPPPVQQIDRRGFDLVNILLLGNDGEITNDGSLRTDTMIVVSINRNTGTVAMISFPRDLYVYIPGWTMQRLNIAYIHGESIGWTDGGFGLMRQTLFYNFGINVHYYAMVDLDGFKALVDAVGGINLAVDCAIQDLPLVGAEVPRAAVRVTEDGEYALPVGYYAMNGAEALWYARSRSSSSDFDRGRRQQQVLRAVWRQARDAGLLNTVPQLWNEASQYIETNMTFEDILGLVPIAANLDSTEIENFVFVRGYHTIPWQPPDGINVQLPVPETVRELMTDFYSPATESQITMEAASVRVWNGSTIPNLDLVAAERLAWERLNAFSAGSADSTDYSDTIIIDYTGRSKGSALRELVNTLNVRPENIRAEPSAEREVDFDVILGANYNSCVEEGLLPVEIPPAAGS